MNTTANITNLHKNNSDIIHEKRILSNVSNVDAHFKNLMSIYVVPADSWDLTTENFTMSQVNLTWVATEFKDDTLDFNITFGYPYYISPLLTQDTLVVWMHANQTIFRSSEAPYSYLNENSTILRVKIPKQQPNIETVRDIDNAISDTEFLLNIAVAFNVAMNTIFSGSMIYLASMINAFQFIFHLPIMTVIFPANIIGFF